MEKVTGHVYMVFSSPGLSRTESIRIYKTWQNFSHNQVAPRMSKYTLSMMNLHPKYARGVRDVEP